LRRNCARADAASSCCTRFPTFRIRRTSDVAGAARDVLRAAEDFDFLVIEDDPYGELVYVDGADTTAMKSRDTNDRVLYLGSFSKVLAPGLRCGWIVAPKELLAKLEIAKQAADLCSGMLDQSIVDSSARAALCGRNRQSARLLPRQARHTDRCTRPALCRPRDVDERDGGLFTFMTLHDEVDTATRINDAVAQGVAFIPGGPFFVDGSGANTMRLTFAKEPDDRIREGVVRLAQVLHKPSSVLLCASVPLW